MQVAGSKKGKIFLSDVESEKKRELERRRKLRIQQVRQQSKDLANVIRKKVQSEKENEETRCKNAERIVLHQYYENKLRQLEELYRHCLEDIGDSHIQAAREPNAELILKAKQAQNAAEALVRGEEAKRRQEEILLEQKIQKEAPIKQKKFTRAKEDLRSALIVRLPCTRDKVKNKTDCVQSRAHKSDSTETTKSVLEPKSDQKKMQILQEIPSNIRLQTEDDLTGDKSTQDADTNKTAENLEKSCRKDISASSHTVSANRSSGEYENINKCAYTCSCNHHIDNDEHSKRKSENKVSSDRGYHSDGDYDSTVKGLHQHCINKHNPCHCRVKYYDHHNHFQSYYKRLNPVTPHHETDTVNSAGDLFDENSIKEKSKRLEENMQKSQARGREAIRRQLAKQKFQKLLKELSTLEKEERIARCKALISNVNLGESLRRSALATKQQRMDMAFERLFYTTTPRNIIQDDGDMDYPTVTHPAGKSCVTDSPPATLNVADWKTFAASHTSSQSFHPFYEYSKDPLNAYHSSSSAPQYSSPPVRQAVAPPVVSHLPPSAVPPSPPSPQPPDSHKLPDSSPSVSQNNKDEEDTLNAICQRLDHHRKVLLGESAGIGDSNNQKENPNKRLTLAFSKQFAYSVNPEETKTKVIDDNEAKSSEVSVSHTDIYTRRRKLSKVRSRPETRKKQLPRRDRSGQWCKVSNMPSSASKVGKKIQNPAKEHYNVNINERPAPNLDENIHILKKFSVNSEDAEAIQGDNELPLFDGVEVTIRVSEKDKKKSPKKIKQRNLYGHENQSLTKPNKLDKITDSSTSYYSPPDKITPSQQNMIDTIISHIRKRGLSSHLKLHIQNLLSMSRENVNDLGISSSDISIDSINIEPVSTKQVITKDTVQLQNEAQCTDKTAVKSEVLKQGRKELRMEAAQKTADIMSQYSQLSEMLVAKIEKLAKVGSFFSESFKPNIVNETSAIDPDIDISRYPASTAESSYLYLPSEVNPDLPVGRNLIEAFSSNNRYSQLTPTFNELPEPVHFEHTFFIPFQTEIISKKIPELSVHCDPNNSTQPVEDTNVPKSNNSFIQQPEVQLQHRETERRSMPPPTLSNGRFRFGMESSSPPHELTTIPEVDTPGTHCYSNSNIFSEQESEMDINVFEGLNLSQEESDSSSESIKSFDSVSSVPDVDSVLMKRNVITSPFENRRKRKVKQILQNKESQKNLYAGSSNETSNQEEHYKMNTSSSSSNSDMRRNLSDGNHIDLENISISPVQHINHRLEIKNNVNSFTGHNEVNNFEKSSSFKPGVKHVSIDNIMCKLIEINNTKQPVPQMSTNEQVISVFKSAFKNNVCPLSKADKHLESCVKKMPFESHVESSEFLNERLAKFNEILRDLDEAEEIMSDSTPEDLELAFHRLGISWAGTTLRKTQEAQELNSGSTSGTSEVIRKSNKREIKEKNIFSNRKRVEEDLTPPDVSLRAPVLLSSPTTNLKKYKTRKCVN